MQAGLGQPARGKTVTEQQQACTRGAVRLLRVATNVVAEWMARQDTECGVTANPIVI